MKTYNTIEDILNDHEFMAKPLRDISQNLWSISKELFDSIPENPTNKIFPKSLWIKSEYERRQKEYKDKFLSHDGTNEHFAEQNFKPMEKKPNLIPFDLEKAKAGAKVWQGKTNPKEVKIISDKGVGKYSIIALIDLQNGGETVGRFTVEGFHIVNEKNESLDLFIESEPLPEMWTPVFKNEINEISRGLIYKSKEFAHENSKHIENYIGTGKITFE